MKRQKVQQEQVIQKMTFDFGSQELVDNLRIKNKELEDKLKSAEIQLKKLNTPSLSPRQFFSKPLSFQKKTFKLEPSHLLLKQKKNMKVSVDVLKKASAVDFKRQSNDLESSKKIYQEFGNYSTLNLRKSVEKNDVRHQKMLKPLLHHRSKSTLSQNQEK